LRGKIYNAVRILLSLDGQRSTTTLPALIERLDHDGIPVAAGAMTNDEKAVLLFDNPDFAHKALLWLARVGISAQRG
jgi:hypothetical protein